uniref:USP domain-containing protein n=1 Tax=Lactuca sativa TaxID=4236 RepID=A0A9R1UJV7_LACSA|nr:hypothetical protein LSAT_V11C900499760 [Lactuca sativa]
MWHIHEYEVKRDVLFLLGVPGPVEWQDWEKMDRGDQLPLGLPQVMMALTRDGFTLISLKVQFTFLDFRHFLSPATYVEALSIDYYYIFGVLLWCFVPKGKGEERIWKVYPKEFIQKQTSMELDSIVFVIVNCDTSYIIIFLPLLQIGYPTLHAFVEFISGFDMPSDIHSKKKDNILLENGKPFRPIMFESVLNNFSPDMPDSFSRRPRQEDAQVFLSFVMHQMHDELLELGGEGCNFNGGKVSLVSSVSDEDDDDSWETVGPKNKTAITRTQSSKSF